MNLGTIVPVCIASWQYRSRRAPVSLLSCIYSPQHMQLPTRDQTIERAARVLVQLLVNSSSYVVAMGQAVTILQLRITRIFHC